MSRSTSESAFSWIRIDADVWRRKTVSKPVVTLAELAQSQPEKVDEESQGGREERESESDAGGSLFKNLAFVRKLDGLRDSLHQGTTFEKTVVGSTLAVSTGVSVGYVLWLIRGGMLLSSVLSSLPAWRFIDPLPVLANLNQGSQEEGDDGESLESVVDKGQSTNTP